MKWIIALTLVITAFTVFTQDKLCTPMLGSEPTNAELISVDGDTTSFSEIVGNDKVVVIVYRGSWCPYCRKHLKGLQENEQKILDEGYRIIGISTDDLTHSKELIDKLELNYELYSDNQMIFSDSMGLSFTVDAKTIKRYDTYGIDLSDASGKSHNKLPHPAVLVYSRGLLQFSYINPVYKTRLDPEVLLAVLSSL